MKRGDKLELVQILDLIKLGESPSNISKKNNIPKSTLQYSLNKLKKLGCINKKGYGVWEYKKPLKEVRSLTTRQGNRSVGTSPKKEIRGHAFIWKIEFIQSYDWKRIVRTYKKKKLTFQTICSGQVLRTIFNNRKIWLNKKGLTIYEAMDFYGKSSFSTKGMAVFEMDRLIKDLLKELNQPFRPYRFSTSREHYGMIKNELAKQYNDRKEKMIIRGEDGTAWLWIDDSEGLGELETQDPNISKRVQDFWNDHKRHNFEVTPSFVLGTMNGIQQNQLMFAKNMESHIDAIKKLGQAVEDLRSEIGKGRDL